MIKQNIFYAQSGGVTAVINASACGVIETARAHKDKIGVAKYIAVSTKKAELDIASITKVLGIHYGL